MRSRFLSVCAGLAVLGAAQCLVMPFWWASSATTTWNVAWCSPSSPTSHWVLLFLWTASAAPIVTFAVKKRRRATYVATMVSYCLFWSFAFFAQGPPRTQTADLILVGAFLALMLRAYRTASSSNRLGMRSNST